MQKKVNRSDLKLSHNHGNEKIPPQEPELEQAILGGCMFNSNNLMQILPLLKSDVFYNENNRIICQAILDLVENSEPVDMYSVTLKLKKMGKLEEVGGAYYVAKLSNNIEKISSLPYHYRVLMEKYFRRKVISTCYKTANDSYNDTIDIFETCDTHTKEFDDLQMYISSSNFMNSKDVSKQLMDIVNATDDIITYYPTNDKNIDETLMISPSNLILMSGKSGSGKTTFAVYMARLLLQQYKNEFAFCWYTMEDEAYKLQMNFISPKIKLTHAQMHGKNYKLSEEEKQQIAFHSNEFNDYDIEFYDKPAYMSHIKAHFERFCAKRTNKFCILVIDNLMGLRDNEQYRFKSKSYEVDDHIANKIQGLFSTLKKDHKINIWYLHHLTKEQLSKTNANDGYRPREDNIKGSTRLRDIATQGLLIHRPGEFQDMVRNYKKTDYEKAIEKLILVEAFKNRNGNTGVLRYFGNLAYKILYPF